MMIHSTFTIRRSVAGLAATGLLLAGGPGVLAGPAGAIFTTDAAGQFVNGNVYDQKGDVFLNGGPRPNAPCTAAGLPNGEYYFQVTNPSGREVLSSDGIEARKVLVAQGVITENRGTHVSQVSGFCGSVTVRLCPFATTVNEGDEYKVWMTSVADHEAFHGFARQASKTDNFKVTGEDACGGAD